jgi:hypothetical protein
MEEHHMTTKLLPLAATLALAIAACSGTKPNSANLSVSAKLATSTAPSAPTSIDAGNGVSIDEIRVVVRKLKLEGAAAAADAGTTGASSSLTADHQASDAGSGASESGAGDDGKTEVEHEEDTADEPVLGPLLADVTAASLAGGIEQVFNGQVPEGTFHELKFVIGPVTAAPSGADAKFAELVTKNASIIIDYTVTDSSGTKSAPLQFVSSLTAEFKIEGDIVVSATKSNNLTLSLDPSKWFVTGTTFLDPRMDANKAAIEANIQASLDAFEDDDKSGHENHGGDGPGHQ